MNIESLLVLSIGFIAIWWCCLYIAAENKKRRDKRMQDRLSRYF